MGSLISSKVGEGKGGEDSSPMICRPEARANIKCVTNRVATDASRGIRGSRLAHL